MEKEKLTFKDWWENTWYHYKWPIICGVVLVIFLAVSLGQLFSKEDADIKVLHVGPMYISPADSENFTASLESLMEDYNGDGDTVADLMDLTIAQLEMKEYVCTSCGSAQRAEGELPDDFKCPKCGAGKDAYESASEYINYDEHNKSLQRFQTEIRAGDSMIYIIDKEYFDVCMSENLLEPLDSFVDDIDMPENVLEGCGVMLKDLDASKLPGLNRCSENAVLCLRRSPEKDELTYGRTQEQWEAHRKTFIKLLKYENKE